ncbi:MAG: hypothetical protein QXG39_10360 [Candidatus Aenigmatarchaeota archaeon]
MNMDTLLEELNKILYYSFEFHGFAPRRVEQINSIEIRCGELHVAFKDNCGNRWIQTFKGDGWRRCLEND